MSTPGKGLVLTIRGAASTTTKREPRLLVRTIAVAKGLPGAPGDRYPAVHVYGDTSQVDPDCTTEDAIEVRNLAQDLYFSYPGVGHRLQRLMFAIEDDGTPHGLTFDFRFRALVSALPTQTLGAVNEVLYLGFMYNLTDDRWDLMAVAPPT